MALGLEQLDDPTVAGVVGGPDREEIAVTGLEAIQESRPLYIAGRHFHFQTNHAKQSCRLSSTQGYHYGCLHKAVMMTCEHSLVTST